MKKVLCLMLVAVMAIGLAACGGLKLGDIEGKYDFVEIKEGKSKMTADDLKKMSPDAVPSLEIKDDGSAELKGMGNDAQKMTFDVDKKEVKVEKEKSDFTYDDGKLVIKDKKKNISMTFKKK